MPHPEDLALARAVNAAEPGAFDAFYERVFPRVHAYAQRRLGRGALSRAVTEASFVALLEALPGYEGDTSLEAVALGIVKQLVDRAGRASARPLALGWTSKDLVASVL